MYEDSWYSYVPDSKKEEVSSKRRRESLLKQPNGNNQILELADPTMEVFEEDPGNEAPPKATLARRAKSYSDFYDAAIGYFGKEKKEQPRDVLEVFIYGERGLSSGNQYEEYENDILDASHEEYQLYRDQLALSERHLDSLLDDTASALDLLATLSESFKAVESQTTAFQAQCEDLLGEQKRLRSLADEVGTDLQYYAYLEPLTRRLNAPGAGRLIRSDDFLDMLANLNTCIDFMEQHGCYNAHSCSSPSARARRSAFLTFPQPNYRDSSVYKTRYISLLQRSLNLVQIAFSSAMKEISDDVALQLKAKNPNETTQYILLYGKYEGVVEGLGNQIKQLLSTAEYAFGSKGAGRLRSSYVQNYHELFRQITETYLRGREPVGPLISKNLRKCATEEPLPDKDFLFFARRCIQYVFDMCKNEMELIDKFFFNGPLLQEYPNGEPTDLLANYAEKLEENRLSHLKTLQTFLAPYLSTGDLHRICDLLNWLETTYLGHDTEEERDSSQNVHRATAHVLLTEHLWPLADSLFIKAASQLEHFKPTADDLKVSSFSFVGPKNASTAQKLENDIQIANASQTTSTPVSTAYPTVKTAVSLLVMYNEGLYDRPKGEVLYEIVHQVTESLQRAATVVKRNSGILDAQVFLIKNLMLLENLFMTHEIPDSIRQSAELDFTPIYDTIRELQARKQLFNPLAYVNPLFKGQLVPGVKDKLLNARKDMESVLVQQITAFTKYWQGRLSEKGQRKEAVLKAQRELEELLDKAFDETTKAGLWRMIQVEDS